MLKTGNHARVSQELNPLNPCSQRPPEPHVPPLNSPQRRAIGATLQSALTLELTDSQAWLRISQNHVSTAPAPDMQQFRTSRTRWQLLQRRTAWPTWDLYGGMPVLNGGSLTPALPSCG